MKTISYLSRYLLSIFVSMQLNAQQVKVAGSYIYIDSSAMPTKAKRTLALTTHNELSDINKVTTKFAVAPQDATYSNSRLMTWNNAKSVCAAYKGPSGTEAGVWRLPNQRELMRMTTLKEKLESCADFSRFAFGDNNDLFYWSQTSSSEIPSYVWVANFYHAGLTRYNDPNELYYVRCVRDYP